MMLFFTPALYCLHFGIFCIVKERNVCLHQRVYSPLQTEISFLRDLYLQYWKYIFYIQNIPNHAVRTCLKILKMYKKKWSKKYQLVAFHFRDKMFASQSQYVVTHWLRTGFLYFCTAIVTIFYPIISLTATRGHDCVICVFKLKG